MAARAVLEQGQIFPLFSDTFKDDLVKMMVSFDAPEGHIFIKEGDPINSFLIVESGTLQRTKEIPGEGSIEIDVLGPGGATGFLHVAGHPDPDVAYATISARKGGAKIWVVPGGHFRKMCEDNPKVSGPICASVYCCNIQYSCAIPCPKLVPIKLPLYLQHASEVIKVLTVLLRSSTKIVRATVMAKEDKDIKARDNEKKKVLKMLCYDTTSWVKENFEPQVRTVCE